MSITFYSGLNRSKFTNTAEPTIESQSGTDSLAQSVSAGGQVPDLMDGNRQTLLTSSFDTTVVTNGTFATNSVWGKTNEWSIGSGVATVGGGAGTSVLTQTALIVGVKYSVTFDVTNYLSGSVTVKLGTTDGTVRSSAATFVETLTCAGNTTLTFTTFSGADLSIDNVIVKPLDLRFDLAANERVGVSCLILDNMDIWDALPAAAREVVDIYYHTSDVFASATPLTPTRIYGGRLGKGRPYLDFDGLDNKVTISDSANLDFGNGNGSFDAFVSFGNTTDNHYIFGRRTDADNRMFFGYLNNGTLSFFWKTSATLMHQSIASFTPVVDQVYHIVMTFSNGSANALYVDGASLTLTTNTSTGGNMLLSDAMELGERGDAGEFSTVKIHLARQWNRALSSSEVTALYNGGVVAVADQWGRQTTLQTSTMVNDNYTTFSGATSTGFAVVWGSGTERAGTVDELTLVKDVVYRVTFNLNAASGQNPTLFLATALNGSDIGGGSQTGTPGLNSLTFTCTQTTTGVFQFQNTAIAGYTLANFSITPLGCLAEYVPDGINKDDSKWYDTSSNNLDGTITGAEYKLTPNGSDRGFLLYEFAETHARYWFVDINGADLTPSGNAKMGQLVLGKRFTPSASPDLNGVFGMGTGTTTLTGYGGQKHVYKRHGSIMTRTFSWSYMTVADKVGFEELFADVEVSLDGPSLYPLYYAEQALASDDPILRCARIIGQPEFTEVAYGAYRLSLVLEDEV